MLRCYSFGKSLTAKITSVSLHPSHLKSLCVHCEMGDFKHLWRKIITAPLHIAGCVQQLLSYKLGATRSFAKRAGSLKRLWGGSDATDVYLQRELSPTSRPGFQSSMWDTTARMCPLMVAVVLTRFALLCEP